MRLVFVVVVPTACLLKSSLDLRRGRGRFERHTMLSVREQLWTFTKTGTNDLRAGFFFFFVCLLPSPFYAVTFVPPPLHVCDARLFTLFDSSNVTA